MKRTLVAIVALLAVAGSPSSQASTDREGALPPQLVMEEMAVRLDLTDDQQARIAPALQSRNERLKALAERSDTDATRRGKLKLAREGRAIQQDFVAAVTPVLTKEQNAERTKMRDETREQLAQRRQRRQQ